MKLQSIDISRGYSGDQPLHGKIKFSTPEDHEITITLTEEDAITITRACAEAVARAGREAAKALTADMLRTTAIEHKA
jgi:hypothetical protein